MFNHKGIWYVRFRSGEHKFSQVKIIFTKEENQVKQKPEVILTAKNNYEKNHFHRLFNFVVNKLYMNLFICVYNLLLFCVILQKNRKMHK